MRTFLFALFFCFTNAAFSSDTEQHILYEKKYLDIFAKYLVSAGLEDIDIGKISLEKLHEYEACFAVDNWTRAHINRKWVGGIPINANGYKIRLGSQGTSVIEDDNIEMLDLWLEEPDTIRLFIRWEEVYDSTDM